MERWVSAFTHVIQLFTKKQLFLFNSSNEQPSTTLQRVQANLRTWLSVSCDLFILIIRVIKEMFISLIRLCIKPKLKNLEGDIVLVRKKIKFRDLEKIKIIQFSLWRSLERHRDWVKNWQYNIRNMAALLYYWIIMRPECRRWLRRSIQRDRVLPSASSIQIFLI